MNATHRILALAALLALAGSAAAQTQPELAISLSGFPSEPVLLTDNATESFTLDVTVEAGNFACTGEGALPVSFEVRSDLGGVDNVTVDPNPLVFALPSGPHGSGSYNETQQATVTFAVQGAVPSNHSHEVRVVGTYPGGDAENCHSTTGFPAAEGDGAFQATMVASEPADNGTKPPAEVEGDSGIPGPGAPLALVALGLAARRLRRE